MIREKKPGKPTIDLTGPDGNAFALMGRAQGYAKQLGVDSSQIIEDMMSGDWEHLVDVFEKHFGEYVILER
jgi:hypothetical protein